MVNNLFRVPQKFLGTALMLSLLTTACGSGEQQVTGPKAIPVKLETLRQATLIDSSDYVGTLEARRRVNLAPSRTNGRIVKIFAQEGDVVRQGQTLVEIQPIQQKEDVRAAIGRLNVAKAELRSAEAELRQREAERDRAKADVEQARATLASFEADVQETRANLILAEKNYQRSQFLEAEDVVTKEDLDEKTRTLNATQAQLNSNLKTRDAGQESLNAAIQNLRASEKRVEQALANVDSRQSAVVEAEGELGATSQTLAYNFLYAPINGILGSLNQKKIGDNVDIGEVITTITDNQIFNLNVGIPTENRNRLRPGLPVEIINPDGTAGVRGQITYVAPLVDQNAQAIQVKMTFRNDGSLRDQQYVQVRVIWDEKPGVLVPTTAISSLGGQKFVFVAKPGESQEGETSLVAKQIPVKVGSIQGQYYQVISGVQPGDKIAVNRILDLRDGRPIKEESITSQKTIEQAEN